MSSRVLIYPDPGSPTANFDLNGPRIFGFETSYNTKLMYGLNPVGELLLSKLDEDERELLTPKGRVYEESQELVDPVRLRHALLKLYDVACQELYAKYAKSIEKVDDRSPIQLFVQLQRDLAGAVLICTFAEEEGKKVYLTIG